MTVRIPRGPGPDADEGLNELVGAFKRFVADHPGTVADAHRHGESLLKVRIVGDSFRGKSWAERHRMLRAYFEPLSEEVLFEISTVLLLTPGEQPQSPGSLHFDHPEPALL